MNKSQFCISLSGRLGRLVVLGLLGLGGLVPAINAAEFGFSRIVPGWTNYGTAFNLTHDSAADGEYATVASFYTPPVDVRPLEFSAIVIWFGSGNQRLDFADFVFQVHVWSNLEAFIGNPRLGDVATLAFLAPTGGSVSVPNAMTRGGRPAYLLRFNLAGRSPTLAPCHTYLVGVSARATSAQAGELFIPTAPYEGPSDVQAGNVVAFGWQYLLNAGGQTIYSGQLATELKVQTLSGFPSLDIRQTSSQVCLSWPERAGCFAVESCADMTSLSNWQPVPDLPARENGLNHLCLPATNTTRWFRLTKEPESTLSSSLN